MAAAPGWVDLASMAARTSYVGSAEHKSFPSFAGKPQLRADASKCSPNLADPAELTGWLRAAIIKGNVGHPWEGDFPRYVWCRREHDTYEARLVNKEQGQYKGYPLLPDEWPEGLT